MLLLVRKSESHTYSRFLHMKMQFHKGGYSADIANSYIDQKQPIQSLSTELEPQFKFENNKPTEEVLAYKAWFSQEGTGPFRVKFSDKVKLPKYMSLISFDNLQACEVNYNVYFKADGVKEVK